MAAGGVRAQLDSADTLQGLKGALMDSPLGSVRKVEGVGGRFTRAVDVRAGVQLGEELALEVG
jgi:hypothetical protein